MNNLKYSTQTISKKDIISVSKVLKSELLNPVSICNTFLPTLNAPWEDPGRLELIVSVYWEFSREKLIIIRKKEMLIFML